MTIKQSDGSTQSVTSLSQGNLNTVLGAIGTVGTLMGGGASILNGYGYRSNSQPNNDPDSNFITRHEANLMQQLMQKDLEIANKNSELALKESENYTDKKLVEVFTAINDKANSISQEMRGYKLQADERYTQQMAWNATATGTMSTMAAQIAALQSVTKVLIPSSNICQTSCCGCCQSE